MENLEKLIYDLYKKNARQCTNEEIYNALLIYTKNQLFEKGYQNGKKKIYYISAEFLIGKLLSNNLINLGIYDDVAAFLKENGKAIADIEEVEPEPSLGNGGLGRLAACFLDSIATLGLPGEGIGLNYHLGLFKQLFENRLQKETPNPWIEKHSWLTPAGVSYTVPFRGFSLKSSLYDIDVAGYNNKSIHLHLFDIDLADESMVHDGISFNKKDILHNLTLFLYPDDSDDDGRKLRIFQQYFMVSNAAQFILDEATKKGCNLHDLADYAVIQINDTHPSMIIPELIRLLTERGIAFDEAAEIVSKVCAYTNHTILAEALEKWPMDYLLDVVPHLVPIIEKLDEKIKAKYPQENVAIIDKNNLVHMAHMDIHYGFSINGVAALHTEILKTSELKAFYDIYPEKFNNKTNGITFRRWLMHCNHPLTDYITSLIGDEFKTNGYKGFVDVGGAFGVGTYGDGLVSVSSTHGYQFNPYFFLGVGVGVNYHFNWSTVFIPVYADARGYFMNNDIAPFIGLKVGYSVFDGMGFYFNPSVGVRFIATSKLGLNLSIGYNMQRTDITFRQYYYNPRTHDSYVNSYDERNTIGGVMFKLGFEF